VTSSRISTPLSELVLLTKSMVGITGALLAKIAAGTTSSSSGSTMISTVVSSKMFFDIFFFLFIISAKKFLTGSRFSVRSADFAEIKTKAGGGFFVVKISPKNAKPKTVMVFCALILFL
jgi:hypothetical protein